MGLKTVLIVTPYFPPSSLAGVHRARHLAKHLPAAGWHPVVLCVDEAFHEERLDAGLAQLVPATTEVIKVGAISPRYTRPLGLGDLSLRAFGALKRAVIKEITSRTVDMVLITGSPYYPMLLAPMVSTKFGVPVVLDFQDPWVSAWGSRQPTLTKAGMTFQLAGTLEPKALRGAAFVTSVSDIQNAEMVARYAWLDRSRMAAIPIGCDSDDFRALREMPAMPGAALIAKGCINLSFVGTFMPRSEPLVKVVLAAFARARAAYPAAMAPVRLNFIGTSNQPNATDHYRVRPLAQAAGVGDAVNEVPQRVPYLDALGVLARSDGLLLIGSDEPHYTASKIYPALMSGRPYVSLFHADSSAHSILSKAGGSLALSFSDSRELEACEAAISAALLTLATEADTIQSADPAAYARFEARAIAGRFAYLFDAVRSEWTKAA